MIINKKTGRIAYHSILFKEDGELEFKQRDYDGKKLKRTLNENEEFIPPKFDTLRE